MRRLLTTLACALPLALAAAGCGSSGSSDSGKSPLDNALGYMPKSAPVVVALDTDLSDGQWQSLSANAQKFGLAGQIESSLKSSISQAGFDYDKDIKPLLGNDLAISLPTVQTVLSSNSQAVGALEVKDKGKLSDLLSGSKDLTKDGSANGVTLYRGNGSEFGQKDDVFLVADSKQQLVAAAEQRGRNDRLTEDAFDANLSGLPSDALVRGYVDAGALLSGSPASVTARKVKWVAALKTAGFTVSSQSGGIAIDFDAKTDPSQLSDSDLPFATGDASPPVSVKSGEIGIGIRGLDQTEHFIESVAQTISPSGFSSFDRAKKQLSSQLGVDVDKDLIGQLSGNSSIAVDFTGHYAFRAEPKDPATFTKALDKFAKVAPAFAQGAGLPNAKLTHVRGLYRLTGGNGKTIYYGMVGKVFAVSNDLPRLAQIAAQAPQSVPGAKGSLSIDADVGQLVSLIITGASPSGFGSALSGSLTNALGNLIGWTSSSTSGLKGHLELQIK